MTSGGAAGASGEGPKIGPWTVVALIGVVVAFVTATSDIMELQRAGSDIHWAAPVLWEATSAVTIILLAPLVGMAVRRWPPRADSLVRFGLIHLALTVPFAIAHVLAIWITREAAYWAVGARYGFFDDGVALTFLYEWRKDILTYGAVAAVFGWFQHRAERPPLERAGESRIEIRDGGAAVFLAPSDILFVEAAGNYIEFHTATRQHLVRGTLAAWEGRLSQHGFVRAHRSRLVNRTRIAAIKPTPSGDVEITLDSGRALVGSRRYRDALAGPSASAPAR
ncbi:MAG: LytTR family DNA-binding domain-containing protein [Hyphomonadaceae bacterium]